MPRRVTALTERVRSHTAIDGECWKWTGYRNRKGYGELSRGRRADGRGLAHRVAWELAYGRIPDGLDILHRCDTRPCVRPDHLFLGTHADNNRDMAAKGRAARQVGETNGRARLTANQAREIKATTAPYKTVAVAYGVAPTTVRDIRSGRRWRTEP